jgi:tellurite resistance protein
MLGSMDRSAEMLRLQEELEAATSECTAAINEQFLAVIADDPDVSRFDAKVAEALQKRRRAMDSLLSHIRQHGW